MKDFGIKLLTGADDQSKIQFCNPVFEPENELAVGAHQPPEQENTNNAERCFNDPAPPAHWNEGNIKERSPWRRPQVFLAASLVLLLLLLLFALTLGIILSRKKSVIVPTVPAPASPTVMPSLGGANTTNSTLQSMAQPGTETEDSSPSTQRPFCGGTLRDAQGTFTSPYYPFSYPPNIHCVWKIVAGERKVIQLKIHSLNVEGAASCLFDRVEVVEESEISSADSVNSSQVTSRFCGNVPPPTINTNSNRLQVIFISDKNIGAAGFTAQYRIISPHERSCSWDEFLCDGHICLLLGFLCDGIQDCKDGSDETNCSLKHRECGGSFTNLDGSFSSPNHPKPYPHEQICLWRIVVPEGHVIEIHFHNFSLESQDNCNFDFVEVHDSVSMGSTSLLGRFCGSRLPPPLTSSQHFMTILFVADEGVSDEGFTASYHAKNASDYTCGPDEFSCGHRECLSAQWVCDGWNDCSDASDELNCVNISYPSYEVACEPVQIQMCMGLSYNTTSFPNIWLNILDQEGAVKLLKDYKSLLELPCYEQLRPLVCALFVPKCTLDGGVLQPCRSVCLQAEHGCQPSLSLLNIVWPFNCNILPDSNDPAECVKP